MAWITLNSRLSTVPLIIAGSILRRTEKGSVTVWVALKESKHVTLKIYIRSGTILKFEDPSLNIRMIHLNSPHRK